MNLLDLKYFVDIVACGSICAAARANYVSQQSMSGHLKKLEQYYETPLFFRTQPLTLTAAGDILFRRAQAVLDQLDQTQAEIRALSSSGQNFLGVGLIFNDSPPFLGELLCLMQQKYPLSEVRVFDNCIGAGRIPDEAELILSSFPPSQDWKEILLFEDRVAAVVRSDLLDKVFGNSRAAVEQKMLETGDLQVFSDLPFMHFTPGSAPDVPFSGISDPEDMNFSNIVVHTGNGALQNTLVQNGQCATALVMDYAKRTFHDRSDILYFPLSGDHNRCNCSIFYRPDKPLSQCASAFISLALEFFGTKLT